MGEDAPPPALNGDSAGADRLRRLKSGLADAQARQDATDVWRDRGGPPPNTSLGLAFRVAVELVSALAVGFGIGWLLDRWLETRPWLMLVFILLGGAAGILNVYRMARGFGYAAGYRATRDERNGRAGD